MQRFRVDVNGNWQTFTSMMNDINKSVEGMENHFWKNNFESVVIIEENNLMNVHYIFYIKINRNLCPSLTEPDYYTKWDEKGIKC